MTMQRWIDGLLDAVIEANDWNSLSEYTLNFDYDYRMMRIYGYQTVYMMRIGIRCPDAAC